MGATFRRTYTVLGDTAALAARLMARAGEDEIYVSAEAFSRGGGSFAADELEPFLVKGKSEPVQAFVLGELKAAPDEAPAERRHLRCRSSTASASGQCSTRRLLRCAWASGRSSS